MEAKREEKYIPDPPSIAKKIHVPAYEEILARIKSRYPKGGRSLIDRELARLQATYDIAIAKTDFIRSLVRLVDGLHPFYWRLIEIDFDRRKIHESIRCVSRARKIASQLYEKYRVLILASGDRRELLRVSSEARGRILSPFKKCRRAFEYLRNLVVFIQHLPAINVNLPTIIVAGPPSTGKSTLVKNVSRAQTRVASYPFTTTKIHIGHFELERPDGRKVKIQIIDTPGLLDRPIEEMNPVERRAVAALQELEGILLYLVDVSPDAYMDIPRQFRLLTMIINNYSRGKKIVLGVNKIDVADAASLEEARRRAERLLSSGAVSMVVELVAADKENATRTVRLPAEKLLLSNGV